MTRIVLLAVSILLLSMRAGAVPQPGVPCQGKSRSEVHTIFEDKVGIDQNYYTIVTGRHKVPRMIGPRDSQLYNTAQRKAFEEAFSRVTTMGLSYEKAMPHYIEGYESLKRNADQFIKRQDIRIYVERETRNWDECSYTYEIQLAVPRIPSLGIKLEGLLGKLPDLLGSQSGELEISVDDVVEKIVNHPEFVKRLRAALANEVFRRSLKYKDDDTQFWFGAIRNGSYEVSGYPKGQYRINALIGAVIREVILPRVKAYLKEYKRVEIECAGYTDRLPITGKIMYSGEADLSAIRMPRPLSLEAIALEAKLRTSENLRRYPLTNNEQLSVARAYEALLSLALVLREQRSHQALELKYVGYGEESSEQRDRPASRKVVFRIRVEEPYGKR